MSLGMKMNIANSSEGTTYASSDSEPSHARQMECKRQLRSKVGTMILSDIDKRTVLHFEKTPLLTLLHLGTASHCSSNPFIGDARRNGSGGTILDVVPIMHMKGREGSWRTILYALPIVGGEFHARTCTVEAPMRTIQSIVNRGFLDPHGNEIHKSMASDRLPKVGRRF